MGMIVKTKIRDTIWPGDVTDVARERAGTKYYTTSPTNYTIVLATATRCLESDQLKILQ